MFRTITVFTLTGLIMLGLSGCGNKAEDAGEEEQMTEMQDWEKELLCGTYTTDVEQEKISQGELYDYQLETLNAMRSAAAYLEEKYPDHGFEFTEIKQRDLNNSKIRICFTADDEDEKYELIVLGDDDFQDNYYAAVLEPVYDEWLMQQLSDEGIEFETVHTDFSGMQGKDITGSESISEIGELGSNLPRDTAIYCYDSEVIDSIEAVIQEKEIYGSYRVYASELFKGLLDADICYNVWLENRTEVKAAGFQCMNR